METTTSLRVLHRSIPPAWRKTCTVCLVLRHRNRWTTLIANWPDFGRRRLAAAAKGEKPDDSSSRESHPSQEDTLRPNRTPESAGDDAGSKNRNSSRYVKHAKCRAPEFGRSRVGNKRRQKSQRQPLCNSHTTSSVNRNEVTNSRIVRFEDMRHQDVALVAGYA